MNISKYFYLVSKSFDDGDKNIGDDLQGKVKFLEKKDKKENLSIKLKQVSKKI